MPMASADAFQRARPPALLRHRPGHAARPRARARSSRPATRSTSRSGRRPSSWCRRRRASATPATAPSRLNAQGQLVTSDGYPVLGDGGPIHVRPAGDRPRDRRRRHGLDQPGPARPDPPRPLRQPAGADERRRQPLLLATPPPQPAGLAGRLEPGALERSNVKPVIEMTRLMEVNRAYTSVASDDLAASTNCAARRSAASPTSPEGAEPMRALYTAATGMVAQELNVQVISNNIANLRTTGYKRQQRAFPGPALREPAPGRLRDLRPGHARAGRRRRSARASRRPRPPAS